MRWRSSPILALGACFVSLTLSHRATGQEHLEPGTAGPFLAEYESDYYRTIRRYLIKEDEVGPGYWARVVCLPAFFPEWVVTLRKGTAGFRVELAAAEEQFWECEPPASKPAEKVRVRRISAPIDERTAHSVRRVWLKAMRDVRFGDDNGMFFTDLDYYYFSAWGDHGAFYSGVVGSPDKGSATRRLVELGELLNRFARAEGQEREHVKGLIDQKSKEVYPSAARPEPGRPGAGTARPPRIANPRPGVW